MKIKNSKIGVLLVNLGTPDSPSVADVRKYLQEFLMDGRVIDIPWLQRFFLVNGLIAPFRAPSSSHGYKQLWTPEGSPLKVYGYKLKELIQTQLGEDYCVSFGMRYQNPSIRAALDELKNEPLSELIVVPLYPQYASASTGSTIEKVMQEIKRWEVIPTLKFVGNFHDHPLFIGAFAALGKEHLKRSSYDHVIFSYHGLPERQILKASCQSYCKLADCCSVYHGKNQNCYRAQCFNTTRLLVKALGLKEGGYTTSFQSRLGKDPWIKPYTDEKLLELVHDGKKRILVFSPAFVADCLETTVEIGIEYQKTFMDNGGQDWQLVESLNTRSEWVACLKALIKEHQEP
ncbi:MAG: ferrochelatase [Candidatus Omnitrophica bacterium]|nr:ferrochelatase [Candidatus Omnitrophota bacterium]